MFFEIADAVFPKLWVAGNFIFNMDRLQKKNQISDRGIIFLTVNCVREKDILALRASFHSGFDGRAIALSDRFFFVLLVSR